MKMPCSNRCNVRVPLPELTNYTDNTPDPLCGNSPSAPRAAAIARRIDMPRSNLYKKIEKYGLTRDG